MILGGFFINVMHIRTNTRLRKKKKAGWKEKASRRREKTSLHCWVYVGLSFFLVLSVVLFVN